MNGAGNREAEGDDEPGNLLAGRRRRERRGQSESSESPPPCARASPLRRTHPPVEEDRFHPSLDDDDSMELKARQRSAIDWVDDRFIAAQFPLLSWS